MKCSFIGEKQGELGQRAGIDRDFLALGVQAQLVCVQRQRGLQPQRVPRDRHTAWHRRRLSESHSVAASAAATENSKQIGSPVYPVR